MSTKGVLTAPRSLMLPRMGWSKPSAGSKQVRAFRLVHLRGFKSSAPPFSHLLMDSRPDRSFCIMNAHSVSSRVGLNDPQC